MNPTAERIARNYPRFERHATATRTLLAFGITDLAKLNAAGNQFAVLSGYRAELGKHENQNRHGNLIHELQKRGYRRYVPLKSSWLDEETKVVHGEKSVLVPGMSFHDGVELMQLFKQDAIVFKDPSGTIGIYFAKGKAIMAFDANNKDIALLMSQGGEEYSKGRDLSFGLQLVEQDFRWAGSPITKDVLMHELTAPLRVGFF